MTGEVEIRIACKAKSAYLLDMLRKTGVKYQVLPRAPRKLDWAEIAVNVVLNIVALEAWLLFKQLLKELHEHKDWEVKIDHASRVVLAESYLRHEKSLKSVTVSKSERTKNASHFVFIDASKKRKILVVVTESGDVKEET